MIRISDHAEGCVLSVRAQPGARRNALVGEQAGALKVAVTAPAQDGRANKAVIEVLCEKLALRKSQLELIAGVSSREKKFLIRGLKTDDLTRQLNELLPKK